MNIKPCAKCLFKECCDGFESCDDYYPADIEASDDFINEMTRNLYEDFKWEWNEYIERFYA